MHLRILSSCFGLFLFANTLLLAQDAPGSPSKESPEQPTAPAEAPATDRQVLESKFKLTLTKATFTGRWTGIDDGKLTAEKEDRYYILGVTKISADNWIIRARIQYGTRDFVVPIPIQVQFAGDTPVLIVDDVGVPGGNKYSARVLIYGNTYAGTWSGPNVAGLLSGLITHESASKPDEVSP